MSMRYPAGFISAFYDPLKNPNAPTIGTATAGFNQISVTFTAPSNIGGSAITSYIVTARRTSNGDLTSASGASSPVVVTGLVNGEAYTATAVAVNSYGPSVSSAATASVTPVAPPTVIGQAYGGGYYAGQIGVSSVATHYLIVGPLSTSQFTGQWKTSNTATAGTTSIINGPGNTAAMIAAGASAHPCGQFCDNLVTGGFSDWYMPAYNELEVCYFNLKPTTQANNTSSGINANAVPARASNYTAGTPAQTSATTFRTGNAEAFATGFYWSSTEDSVTSARRIYFATGNQYGTGPKDYSSNVRAIRRIPV